MKKASRTRPAFTSAASAIALVLVSVNGSVAQPSEKAIEVANARKDEQLKAFINKQEIAFEKAKQRLLRNIDVQAKLIQNSADLSADQIRVMLQHINADRKAFAESDRLPTCDELIDVVIDCLALFQPLADGAEIYRQRMANNAVKKNEPAALARLEKLEKRLADLRMGGDLLRGGSEWKGERHTDNGSLTLRLIVENREGAHFTGRLVQEGQHGRPAQMRVEGSVVGHQILVWTTGMVLGEHREFHFDGVVVGHRILASMHGRNVQGKPLTGWVSLVTSPPDVRRARH